MNAHPQIVSVGEMSGINKHIDVTLYQCSCGELVNECPFWRQVVTGMHERGYSDFAMDHFGTRLEWGSNPLVRRLRSKSLLNPRVENLRDQLLNHLPEHQHKLQSIIQRNADFAAVLLDVSGKRVVFDTAKARLRLRYLMQSPMLDLRVIHLVRDVRGVVNSRLKRNGGTIQAAVSYWTRYNRAMREELKLLPDPQMGMVLRYEDLCQNLDENLLRLYEFCGVEPISDLQLDTPHHILGNPMRMNGVSEVRLDEKWRHDLSSEQIATIDSLSVAGRKFYDYADMSEQRVSEGNSSC